ncbi:transposable element Tcb1 transposase [Trichonephila clavipes]|nr:transposable element Tcb1 transposase [Trichonephila clavipes]
MKNNRLCAEFRRKIGSRVGRIQTTVMRLCDRWMQETEWSIRKTSIVGLPLTQNHRRLRGQWCEERRMWVAEWNEVVFTDKSRICLQHDDDRIRVWRYR